MAKKKVRELEDVTFQVAFKCPNTGAGVLQTVDRFDFHASDSPCDMCGSHGEIVLTFKCNSCDVYHEYQLQGW